MKKRWVSIIMAACLTAGLISGCSSQGKASSEAPATANGETAGETAAKTDPKTDPVTLELFLVKAELLDLYTEIAKGFEAENPGVKINVVSVKDPRTVLMTRISTNDIPDIMCVWPAEEMFHKMMDEGILADLTGQPFMDNAFESSVELASYKGKNYALPVALSAYGLFYNVDMFEENGITPPTTYEEFIDVCEKFKALGITPVISPDKDGERIGQEAERLCGIVRNDIATVWEKVAAGETSFTTEPEIRKMAEAMLQIRSYQEDSLAVSQENVLTEFMNGNCAMFISGTWSVTTLKSTAPDLNCKMIPFPNPTGEHTKVPINIDSAISISSTTKDMETSVKFLEYFTSPEVAQKYCDGDGNPSVIKSVQYNVEQLVPIKEVMDKGDIFVTPVNFWPAGTRQAWEPSLQQLIIDGDVDEFLKSTDALADEFYNNK